MSRCGCGSKENKPSKNCPLCHRESGYVNYRVVETVVKEDLKKLVMEDNYYTCNNEDCDAVFFNEEGEQIYLTIDVDLTADFEQVTKKENSCGGSCDGACGGGCGH